METENAIRVGEMVYGIINGKPTCMIVLRIEDKDFMTKQPLKNPIYYLSECSKKDSVGCLVYERRIPDFKLSCDKIYRTKAELKDAVCREIDNLFE